MKRILFAILLGLMPVLAGAAPITFLTTQYLTSAVGVAGAVFNSASDQSPPSALPLTNSALADDGTGIGAAAAFADVGVLIAQADALGSDDGASGAAGAEFVGTFGAPGGLVALLLDFTADAEVEDDGFAESLLRVIVLADATTVFDQLYSTTGVIQALIDLPIGALGTLNLQVAAVADAAGPLALASAGGAVIFSAQAVPEPGGAGLTVLAGLAVVVVTTHARRRRSAGPVP